MAERKAQNKYYPPDFDWKKHGTINRYRKSHPLGDRARKLKTGGGVIIRFEMPWNVWCDGCKSYIAQGVRYNAEKTACGNFLSTTLWEFKMNCHLCPQKFVIQTDPEHNDFKCVSGLHRKAQEWDAEDNGTIPLISAEESLKRAQDAFYKLEQLQEKAEYVTAEGERAVYTQEDKARDINSLLALNESQWQDDFAANQALRVSVREAREADEADKKDAERLGLGIRLLRPSLEDKQTAARQVFLSQTQLGKRQKARQGDIFGGEYGKTALATNPDSSTPRPALTVAAALAPVSDARKTKKKSKKSSKQRSEGGLVAY